MGAVGVIADVDLPAILQAAEPPEARGLRRDDVRLLVSDVEADTIEHARFSDLPRWVSAGDVLVVNTSGTLNAALAAADDTGRAFELHLSTRLPGGFWTVEVREPGVVASRPSAAGRAGARFRLPADGHVTLLAPYPLVASLEAPSRLWIAALQLPRPTAEYLEQHGFPIRYGYVPHGWPSAMYQTVFATEPGSAEMPSAARPFSHELVTRLIARGVQFAPVLLHTGVASQEKHEPPYEEFYRVPRETADLVNAARRDGRQVIGVGTTAVRALETVTDDSGRTSPGEGWTSLVVTPDRRVRSVTGLITGLHEPRATHLALLEAVAAAASNRGSSAHHASAARRHLQRAYAEARRLGYLWHEFGDAHLILAGKSASV
ncbi:MAG TPA: S-adenosylmethionine:tRNA ribosyltransferase-isomerase [Vicinamibacterales bacterium]|nr:S-adenosylmethionine:tRNA ribosyltransferase-isomerase [Vicinamibacterales bacterium]